MGSIVKLLGKKSETVDVIAVCLQINRVLVTF
jgi:hypothetical protein